MPNWCSNYILIESDDPAKIDEVLAGILDGDKQFDFNKLVPMPLLLTKTASGSRQFDNETKRAWYSEGLGEVDLNRPFTPEEESQLTAIGFANWYDWSIANWGTKWNASSTEVDDGGKDYGLTEVRYTTAWSPPVPVLAKLREMFPDVGLSFRCRYEDDHEFPHEVEA